MSSTKHPEFKNPLIGEALCEIHFSGMGELELKDKVFEGFSGLLKTEYPSSTLQTVNQIIASIGPEGVLSNKSTTFPRLIYSHATRPHIVQLSLSPGILTINEISKYPGWVQFKNDIQRQWLNLESIVKPATVARVGLRYINKVPRKNRQESLGEWIKSSDYYPKQILSSTTNVMCRYECETRSGHRLILTIADIPPENNSYPFVLDIDLIHTGGVGSEWKSIESAIESLHEEIWDVFQSTLTERLKTILNGN